MILSNIKKKYEIFIITLLWLILSFNSQAQCYERFRTEGIKSYNEGNYSKANDYFSSAKKCSDVPVWDDLDEWMSKANDQIRQVNDQKKKECFESYMQLGRNAFNNKNYKDAKDYFKKAKECEYEYDGDSILLNDADYWIKETQKFILEMIFEDAFDDNKNNWPIQDLKECKSEINNGKLIIEHKKSGQGRFFWKSIPDIKNKDFVIETKISCIKYRSNSVFCLTWGIKDNINFYAFKFYPKKNEFEIYGEENKDAFSYTILEYNNGLLDRRGIASNTVSIKRVDRLIGFYINGKNEYTASFQKLFGDSIGYCSGLKKLDRNLVTLKFLSYEKSKTNI